TIKSQIFTECENALVGDIVFLVDSSGSIGSKNFELVKTFLGNVIKPFDIGPKKIQFGLAQYSTETRKEFLLKDFADQESVLTKVQQLHYLQKNTRTGEALDFIRKDYFVEAAGSRVGELVPQIAVLITDGESSDSVETPAQQLRDHGVLVFCVGVGKDAQKQLKTIANPPQDHYITECSKVINDVRTCCLLSSSACAETRGADIFFLLDVSGRIGQLDLRDMQNFIISFLRFLPIGPDHVRMGVVTYSHSPSLRSGLMEDADEIKEAVLALQREGGAAYVGKALAFLNQGMGETAERQVPRFLVVISGGEATDDFKGPAEALRRKDITLLAIGAKKSNETQLTEISGDSRQTFYVNHFDALESISEGVLAEICAPEGEFGSCILARNQNLMFGVRGLTLP
uniref:VWFA domain-containing protein n=1 Tax=Oryzias sinensis TaxID=183150 RepID=A0A8C7WYE7_9TELE